MSQVAYRTYVCFNHCLDDGFTLNDEDDGISLEMVPYEVLSNNIIYRSTKAFIINPDCDNLSFTINGKLAFGISINDDVNYKHVSNITKMVPNESCKTYSIQSCLEFDGMFYAAALEIHTVEI